MKSLAHSPRLASLVASARSLTLTVAAIAVTCVAQAAWAGPKFEHVIQISVDGLRPDFLQQVIDAGDAPTFARLQREGAWTHNARTDYDYSITLPNHSSMVTGRSVLTPPGFPANTGHGHTENGDPASGETIHLGSGRGGRGGRGEVIYVASTFDVAHDNGLSTAIYASKSKFSLFSTSYNATNGRDDVIGDDNGKNKIDVAVVSEFNSTAAPMIRGDGAGVTGFAADLAAQKFNYAFVHIRDTDTQGHAHGWGGPEYMNAVRAADSYLSDIFAVIDGNPALKNSTAVIITADHGGEGTGHSDANNFRDYTIPFYVWGAGIPSGADLYDLNPDSRVDPGTGRPTYLDPMAQPIRNGDSGNLALDLLGLEAIPGSIINLQQNLHVSVPEPATGAVGLLPATAWLLRRPQNRN